MVDVQTRVNRTVLLQLQQQYTLIVILHEKKGTYPERRLGLRSLSR